MLNPAHRSIRAAGFTLAEVVIAAAAMALVLVYTLNTFSVNRNTYVVIENVSEAHQNSLAISGLLERDLRNAGYMVPPGAAACGADSTTGPDMLFVSDSDVILPADDPALAAAFAGGNLAATPNDVNIAGGTATVTLDDVSIDGNDSYDTDATAGLDSDFRVDGGAIFLNLADPSDGVFCAIVTAVNATANQITIAVQSSTDGNPIPVTSTWGFVPAHVYRIQGDQLSRDGIELANNVEDLQMAWFYDLDGDNQIDANENFGASSPEPGLTAHTLADSALLREVRLNLVLHTADPDPNNTTAGMGQARENRVSAPPADGRRRRVHTATIRLRNVNA